MPTQKGTIWNFTDECWSAFEAIKKAFTHVLVLTHGIPDTQSQQNWCLWLCTCCSTVNHNPEWQIAPHCIPFPNFLGSRTQLQCAWQRATCDFEAFKLWRHYLKGSASNQCGHWSLELATFSMTKILMWHKAHWSNNSRLLTLSYGLGLGSLGTKPDALTICWDIYLKEGSSDYASVNPQNFHTMFTSEQLASSLQATNPNNPSPPRIPHYGCLSGSMAISKLNSERIPYPMNTLVFSQTWTGPSTPMAYSSLGSDLCPEYWQPSTLCSPIFTWSPPGRTFRSTKTLHRSNNTISVLDSHLCQGINAGHVPPVPKPNPCATSLTDCSSNSWFPRDLVFYLHGFHREASPFIGLYLDPCCCWSSFKAVISIQTHDTITSLQLAQLFILHVFSKHSIWAMSSWTAVQNLSPIFFIHLEWHSNMKLHFTSGYHPEGDGQTEWMNQTLEQYLRVYCNYQQDHWSKLLPLAEFAYNNNPNATTGITPFFPTRVIIWTSPSTLNMTLHWHAPKFSSLTSMSCTNNFGFTLLKLNTNTRHPPIPDKLHSGIQEFGSQFITNSCGLQCKLLRFEFQSGSLSGIGGAWYWCWASACETKVIGGSSLRSVTKLGCMPMQCHVQGGWWCSDDNPVGKEGCNASGSIGLLLYANSANGRSLDQWSAGSCSRLGGTVPKSDSFILSVHLPSGWYPEVKCSFILSAIPSEWKNGRQFCTAVQDDMAQNAVLGEDMENESCASCRDVMVSWVWIDIDCFERWSTTNKDRGIARWRGKLLYESMEIDYKVSWNQELLEQSVRLVAHGFGLGTGGTWPALFLDINGKSRTEIVLLDLV